MTITLGRADLLAIVDMAQYAVWEHSSDEKRDSAIVLRFIDAILASDSSSALRSELEDTIFGLKELNA